MVVAVDVAVSWCRGYATCCSFRYVARFKECQFLGNLKIISIVRPRS